MNLGLVNQLIISSEPLNVELTIIWTCGRWTSHIPRSHPIIRCNIRCKHSYRLFIFLSELLMCVSVCVRSWSIVTCMDTVVSRMSSCTVVQLTRTSMGTMTNLWTTSEIDSFPGSWLNRQVAISSTNLLYASVVITLYSWLVRAFAL